MFASVTRVKVKDMENLTKATKGRTIPDVTTIPGFTAYYVIPGKKQLTTIAVFEDSNGLDNWHNICREHFRDLKDHFEGPNAVDVISGHVIHSRQRK